MRRVIVGIAVAAVLGLEIVAAASGGAPGIHFLQPRHDFAPVPEGVEVTHDFVIQNRGSAELEIKSIETG